MIMVYRNQNVMALSIT